MILKRIIVFIILIGLITNCTQKTKESHQKIVVKQKKKQQEKINIPKHFPGNYIVDEYYPSGIKGKHIFYKNGKYYFIHGTIGKSKKIEIGKWQLRDKYVVISIDKEKGMIPIGEPYNKELVSTAAVPEDYYKYDTYRFYKKVVNRKDSISVDNLIQEPYLIDNTTTANNYNDAIEEYLVH